MSANGRRDLIRRLKVKYEGDTFLRNVGNHFTSDEASHPKRSKSSITPLQETQNLQYLQRKVWSITLF